MQYAPLIALSGQSVHIMDGLPGIFQTVETMRALVKAYRLDPAIRQAAVSTIFLTPEKDEYSECRALFEMVRDNVRYVKDIVNVETIVSPDKTLLCRIGDCDDQSTLLAALFESVGYPTRFIVAAYNDPAIMEHVYLQVFASDQWVNCDPTEQEPFGYAPPDPLTIYIENI